MSHRGRADAEVKIYRRAKGWEGLWWWMKVREEDITAGPPSESIFRVHRPALGSKRYYHAGARVHELEPAQEFYPGLYHLWTWSGLEPSFASRPKRSIPERREIRIYDFPLAHVSMWEVEPDRADAVKAEVFGQNSNPFRVELIHVYWTTPHYLVEFDTDIPIEPGETYHEDWMVVSVGPDGAPKIEVLDEFEPRAPGRGLTGFTGG